MNMNPDIIQRINLLTDDDLTRKTPIQLYLSAVEELGELTREIKIEEKVPGNAHKQPDEGSKAESVDLFICAICRVRSLELTIRSLELTTVDYGFNAENLELENTSGDDDIFELLRKCTFYLGKGAETNYNATLRGHALNLAQYAINIFFNRGGTVEEFIQICHKKLDKWEKTKGK